MSESRPTRVCIVQEIVPRYRVPVFDMLAHQTGIALEVWSQHAPQGTLQPAKGPGSYGEVHAPWKRLGPFIVQKGQIEAAKSGRFDVIIFPWNARMAMLSRALRIARRRGVGTIVWGHGFSKHESPMRRRMRNHLIGKADACLLYSHAAADRLEREGFDPQRLFVAQNAIDQSPIRSARDQWLIDPDRLRRFRAEHGLADRSLVIFISRLEPDKRIELLLRAFAAVAPKHPDAQLAIIGSGSDKSALEEQVRRLNLESRVRFVGSIYDDIDLAPWFLSAACMAYPTAIGLSIFHAFGYGLPVVTSDDVASHNPEIEALHDGENGLLYRDGDAGDFAQKILACLVDHQLRQNLAANAFETVASPNGYCLERMVRGFTDAIAFAQQQAVESR